MLKAILIIIIGGIALFIIWALLYEIITTWQYKHYLLKQSNAAIYEANIWKQDIEYFLNIIKLKGPLTFHFEDLDEVYNYERMEILLERTKIYLRDYNIYVEYVKANRWNEVSPPSFYSGHVVNPNLPTFDALVANLGTTIRQERDIKFLRFLHLCREKKEI